MKEMSDRINQGFVGYEYREISVPEYLSSLCADSYPYFGWRLDGNPAQSKNRHSKSPYVDLRFKRDRKIMNKTEYKAMMTTPGQREANVSDREAGTESGSLIRPKFLFRMMRYNSTVTMEMKIAARIPFPSI